jgi:hypothetical protein
MRAMSKASPIDAPRCEQRIDETIASCLASGRFVVDPYRTLEFRVMYGLAVIRPELRISALNGSVSELAIKCSLMLQERWHNWSAFARTAMSALAGGKNTWRCSTARL